MLLYMDVFIIDCTLGEITSKTSLKRIAGMESREHVRLHAGDYCQQVRKRYDLKRQSELSQHMSNEFTVWDLILTILFMKKLQNLSHRSTLGIKPDTMGGFKTEFKMKVFLDSLHFLLLG